VVKTLVEGFVNPLVGLLTLSRTWRKPGFSRSVRAEFLFGAIVSAIIIFLMTAAVIYFVVVFPMKRSPSGGRREGTPEPATVSEDVALLTEIRDLLRASRAERPRRNRAEDSPLTPHT
jgi:large conductance mechanosensitive channel